MTKENVSAEISWLDRDIKRFKETGNIIPGPQKKIYEKIRDISRGLTVVDVGCSIGYGANIMSHEARHVWGIDVNEEAIDFAREVFARPNVSFDVFDLEDPPSRPFSKFDVVVMSEVIEHLEDPKRGLEVIKRFFQEDTTGFISTPNKNSPIISPDEPNNELHLREWTAGEFYEILIQEFRHVTMYSVPALDSWSKAETIDGTGKDTPVLAKVEGLKGAVKI